jgi:hypothetical protein
LELRNADAHLHLRGSIGAGFQSLKTVGKM